jgi:hypothetical protein
MLSAAFLLVLASLMLNTECRTSAMLSVAMLSMLSIVYPECRFPVSVFMPSIAYTECCISVMLSVIYAESRYAECRGSSPVIGKTGNPY